MEYLIFALGIAAGIGGTLFLQWEARTDRVQRIVDREFWEDA